MRSRRRAAFALVVLVLWPAQAGATTFYVDPIAGSDAASGLSAGEAWLTSTPVNARIMEPGDAILLKAGATHKHMLEPRGSGTAENPILLSTYGGTERALLDPTGGGSGFTGLSLLEGLSHWTFEHLEIAHWGNGNAGVFLQGADHLTFRDLYVHHVDNGFLASRASEVGYITIENSRIADLPRTRPSIAINLAGNAHHWLVRATTLANAGDSCLLDVGHDNTYDGLEVHDCGHWVSASFGAHGLYLRGPNLTIRNSHVWDAASNCVSIRFQDAVVENNSLHGCPIAVAYFHNASQAGRTVRIVRNRIWDVGTAGIYVDAGSPMQFALAHNTIVSHNQGIVVRAGSSLSLENTVVTGSAHPVLAVAGVPIGSILERGNLLYTRAVSGAAFEWPGGAGNFADWKAATGQGSGSAAGDPLLADEAGDLTPALGSPAIDAGFASTSAMTLDPACGGAIDDYCGIAPDIGAVETAAAGPAMPAGKPVIPPPVLTPGGAVPDAVARSASNVRKAATKRRPKRRDTTPPGRPTDLILTRTGRSSVTLAWNRARGADVASYRLLRDGSRVVLVRTRRTRANARGLEAGRVYRFYVVAVDGAGNVSEPSPKLKVTLPG